MMVLCVKIMRSSICCDFSHFIDGGPDQVKEQHTGSNMLDLEMVQIMKGDNSN